MEMLLGTHVHVSCNDLPPGQGIRLTILLIVVFLVSLITVVK